MSTRDLRMTSVSVSVSKNTLFKFSKHSGLHYDYNFLVGRKEPTRVSGFVLIRLGARAMKNLFWKLLKSGPPPSTGYHYGITKDY